MANLLEVEEGALSESLLKRVIASGKEVRKIKDTSKH